MAETAKHTAKKSSDSKVRLNGKPAKTNSSAPLTKGAPPAAGDSRNKKQSPWNRVEVLRDYRIASQSRQASLLGRREVLTGKAKFGIFGDGKEVAQLAMARAFRMGDFRSGYYRDQTFMFALEMSDVQKFFAQLYAHTDVEAEPSSAGRSMNGHFATRSLNPDGTWKILTEQYNSSADISPTGSQMPRLVGLGYASKLYREVEELRQFTQFSRNGNEAAFGTIGNASSAEGMFWEAINAIGVLGAPVVMSIWDDGYGISVPNKYQITKENLGEVLSGFQRAPGTKSGYDIHVVRGWDYPALVETYRLAAETARREHVPQLIHVIEVTQPQGHSTSGSHERYKSKERMEWETEFDGLKRMREWMIAEGLATAAELDEYEKEDVELVRGWKEAAWNAYIAPIREEIAHAAEIMDALAAASAAAAEVQAIRNELTGIREPFRRDTMAAIHKALLAVRTENLPQKQDLIALKSAINSRCQEFYGSNLHSETAEAARNVPVVAPVYAPDAPMVNGSEVMNACFDAALARDPRVLAFGEDLGQLGDVNQGFIGLQNKYGELRVADVGIREVTILGQAIGLAMRGLRPVAEIQYLDYLLYPLQIMSDDLATVQWRTKGGQKAPVIIRTRGHRLEGVWHAGSPMAGVINLVRGIHVCVPRNMTQAAGFYNLLLRSDEPALIVEVLNGYRLKEKLPANVGEFTVPLGVPEILRAGNDVTLVTYGACCRVALDSAVMLAKTGISVEVIDVQTLLPFDTERAIVRSLQKTNRIVFLDEDVPGGTTAYMMQQVIERQGGYKYLDAEPRTLSAKPHRPAYGTDGNYWSKPEAEHIFECVYDLMHESNPRQFPVFYR
jgi:pyruvate/2-oxoglutarate/acetoin dehydrogenase E1 component/TPP-dependent pyruvate/acetoin dehydrogenase alpha subunit